MAMTLVGTPLSVERRIEWDEEHPWPFSEIVITAASVVPADTGTGDLGRVRLHGVPL
jgi:hypothetical protein